MSKYLALVLVILSVTSQAEIQIRDRCDLNGPTLKSLPAASADSCRDECSHNSECRAFTFISGWKRCFLKSSPGKDFVVRMYSGQLSDEKGADMRKVEKQDYDLDCSGKDMRKVVVKAPQQCADECVRDLNCAAFTFIEGYATCWLKKTRGKLYEKKFYCGL